MEDVIRLNEEERGKLKEFLKENILFLEKI